MSLLRTVSLFPVFLWVLWMQALLTFRDRDCGASQMEVLKVMEPHIRFKPFIPQGESGNCVFSSSATVLPWVGVYGDSVSQTLSPILM